MLVSLYIAYGIFILSLLYGIAIQTRVGGFVGLQGMHHTLYFFACAGALVCTGLGVWNDSRMGWWMGGMVVLLFGLTRMAAGTRRYWAYAVFLLVVYTCLVALKPW